MATVSISKWEAKLSFQRNKRAFLVLAAAGLLSGCADYMNHRDSITFGLGNAMEANKGIHTQEPFPRVAENTHIASDGKVIHRAIRTYQGGAQPSPPPPAAVILPAAGPVNGANSSATR